METYIEYIAFAFGIAYVVLAAQRNAWCWLAGIINCALYVYINLHAQLYYDSLLQVFYVVAGFYGWWIWHKTEEELFVIERLAITKHLPLIFVGITAALFFGSITYLKLHTYIAFYDAAIFTFSLIATWMTAKKILENWLWWIVIDIAAIFLYLIKGMPITSIQYLAFTLGAGYGYFEWRKKISTQ